MASPHQRRCWDCGNVALHLDDVVPHVLCPKCGSQDTRRTKAALKRLEDLTEPELSSLLTECGKAVEAVLAKHVRADVRNQFALLVFDDPKVAQYISSCQRATMIEALREAADRLERRETVERTPFVG